jgi:hypothetical protein
LGASRRVRAVSALNDLRLFRIYEPHELGDDGYPAVWHKGAHGSLGVKHLVRHEAGLRCERCKHPYWPDAAVIEPLVPQVTEALPQPEMLEGVEWGEETGGRPRASTNWSPCDEQCEHEGPLRFIDAPGYDSPDQFAGTAGQAAALMRGRVQAAWRILTVHHLNGRKHDLRWWNLIAACQRCHLWLQGTVVMERVYPWEHDHYFKPHAAGWYAYAYLGENLNKMQTMRRLDELLSLERAA